MSKAVAGSIQAPNPPPPPSPPPFPGYVPEARPPGVERHGFCEPYLGTSSGSSPLLFSPLAVGRPTPYYAPESPAVSVGDIKMTLDDLKMSVLHYFSKLYQAEGKTISERLDSIQQYHYPSPFPICRNPRDASFRWGRTDAPPETPLGWYDAANEDGQGSGSRTWEGEPHKGTGDARDAIQGRKTAVAACTPESHSQGLTNNFTGVIHRRTHSPPALSDYPHGQYNMGQHKNQGYPSTSETRRDEKTAVGVGTSLAGGIEGALWDVKISADDATRRLNAITEATLRQTDNPSLRSFAYSTVPRYKRRPCFEDQTEMERHMVQLYGDLHSQVEFNERRIRALRHRLNILQISTLPAMGRLQTDPRIAY